ncbi:MAG: hypothetical protein KC421_07345 [Anaerolineales bacterium]|nr:hypothetical protein [Anaerolineales bacterium]
MSKSYRTNSFQLLPPHRPNLELGRIHLLQGALYKAADRFEQTIAEGTAPGFGMAHLALSEVHYEWNALKTAAYFIQKGLQISQQQQVFPTQVVGYRLWARLQQVCGRIENANEAMRMAHDLTEAKSLSHNLRTQNSEWELLLAIHRHDIQSIERRLERLTIPTQFYPTRNLIYSRALIALGRVQEASHLLNLWLPIAIKNKYRGVVISILIQQALTNLYVPHPLVIDALTLAKKESFRRIFADEGSKMVPLLHAARGYPATAVYAEMLISTAQYTPEVEIVVQSLMPPARPATSLSSLNNEQMQLLKYILNGKSYQDIAEELDMPLQTVKLQLERLSSRLGFLTNSSEAAPD